MMKNLTTSPESGFAMPTYGLADAVATTADFGASVRALPVTRWTADTAPVCGNARTTQDAVVDGGSEGTTAWRPPV